MCISIEIRNRDILQSIYLEIYTFSALKRILSESRKASVSDERVFQIDLTILDIYVGLIVLSLADESGAMS